MSNPWISQVKHQDPTTDINVGSPTLVKLDSGELLAAHDYQGKGIYGQHESNRYTTSVYRSDDNGLTWKLTADLQGSIWATLFVNRGSVDAKFRQAWFEFHRYGSPVANGLLVAVAVHVPARIFVRTKQLEGVPLDA